MVVNGEIGLIEVGDGTILVAHDHVDLNQVRIGAKHGGLLRSQCQKRGKEKVRHQPGPLTSIRA